MWGRGGGGPLYFKFRGSCPKDLLGVLRKTPLFRQWWSLSRCYSSLPVLFFRLSRQQAELSLRRLAKLASAKLAANPKHEIPMGETIYRPTLLFLHQSLPQGSQRLVEVVVGGGDGREHKGLGIPTQRFLSRSEPNHEQTLPRHYDFDRVRTDSESGLRDAGRIFFCDTKLRLQMGALPLCLRFSREWSHSDRAHTVPLFECRHPRGALVHEYQELRCAAEVLRKLKSDFSQPNLATNSCVRIWMQSLTYDTCSSLVRVESRYGM